jgi:hypothetical protein
MFDDTCMAVDFRAVKIESARAVFLSIFDMIVVNI